MFLQHESSMAAHYSTSSCGRLANNEDNIALLSQEHKAFD
jgi:hypothetical protein